MKTDDVGGFFSGPRSSRQPRGHAPDIVVAGYVTALLLPPIGFIVGIVIIAKDHVWHGIAVMTLALAVLFIANVVAGVS